MIVPTSSVYQGSYVYLIEDGRLTRREIDIGYQNAEHVFISKGLGTHAELITSPLGQVTSGTLVDNRSGSERFAKTEAQNPPVDRPAAEQVSRTEAHAKIQRSEVRGDKQ